jgi:F-type H+-transporting ATPase subunit epsilon
MQLDILTPEFKIFSGEVDAVQLPGKEGMFQVLNAHAPIISTLKEGVVKIDLATGLKDFDSLHASIIADKSKDKELRLEIKGGVAEMQGNKLILLAD